jgi:predicted transcriptional regulator
MIDDGRVVTAKLPDALASRLDEISKRIDRSKSWIVRQAVAEWLAEEQRRYELTLEALKAVDEGRTFTQQEVEVMIEQRRLERRKASAKNSERG